MSRVLVVLGTRPEAIKLAPLISLFRSEPSIQVTVVSTGQHDELLRDGLSAFKVKPDVDLSVVKHTKSPLEVLQASIKGLVPLMTEPPPGLVVVQGDTTTTVAAALAAYGSYKPVAHVEAGLRSGDLWSPWPEEGNRRLVDGISRLHFAPTLRAQQNLLSEGHYDALLTGNTSVDAVAFMREELDCGRVQPNWDLLPRDIHDAQPTLLVTQHRRENVGAPLGRILDAVESLGRKGIRVWFPIHPNPAVRRQVQSQLKSVPNVTLLPAQPFQNAVYMLSRVTAIVTDSGGLQEEGPALGVPVIVTRTVTERPEAVECGAAVLAGTDTRSIVDHAMAIVLSAQLRASMTSAPCPFGDGLASPRIFEACMQFLADSDQARRRSH